MNFLYYSLLMLFIVLALFLILLVLIQKGRGGGLSAAFGGVGGNTAFGAKTGDVLTWATSIIFGVFLLLAIGLNLLGNIQHEAATNQLISPTTVPTAAAASVLSGAPIVAPPVTDTTLPPGVTPPSTVATPTTVPNTDPKAASLVPATPATQPAR